MQEEDALAWRPPADWIVAPGPWGSAQITMICIAPQHPFAADQICTRIAAISVHSSMAKLLSVETFGQVELCVQFTCDSHDRSTPVPCRLFFCAVSGVGWDVAAGVGGDVAAGCTLDCSSRSCTALRCATSRLLAAIQTDVSRCLVSQPWWHQASPIVWHFTPQVQSEARQMLRQWAPKFIPIPASRQQCQRTEKELRCLADRCSGHHYRCVSGMRSAESSRPPRQQDK